MSEQSQSIPPVIWETGGEKTRVPVIVFGLVAALGLIVICLGAKLFLEAGVAWRCPVMAFLHLPCPGCGSTRALAALCEGHLLQAWQFNPLVITAIPAGTVAFFQRGSLAKYARWSWPLFAGAVLLNWIYLFCFLPR